MSGKRIHIVLTDDMASVMKGIAEKQQSPISALCRIAVSHWLESAYGIKVSPTLKWGGDRTPNPDNSAGIPPNPLV